MSGRQAKRIRNTVYGTDISLRFRKYVRINLGSGFTTLFADSRRRHYQQLKKDASRGPR